MSTICQPFVGIAALCERDERAADGGLTLLGVVDHLVAPSEENGATRPPRRLVLRLYNAQPYGECTVVVNYAGSDQRRHTAARLVQLDDLVVTVTFELEFDVDTGQALTIDICLDAQLVSRIHLPIERVEREVLT